MPATRRRDARLRRRPHTPSRWKSARALGSIFVIETCGSRTSSTTLALPRRLETASDWKWTCGKQLDKFRGSFSAFVSLWTELAQADKLKGHVYFTHKKTPL